MKKIYAPQNATQDEKNSLEIQIKIETSTRDYNHNDKTLKS